jgi:hypothetical protein
MADKFNWFYAVFKRGDQGTSPFDYRDGMLVTCYDPDVYNPAIDQQEHMQKVFFCVRVSKNYLPYFKSLLIPNRDLDINPFKSKVDEDAFRISGGLVNYAEVGKALGITDIASKVRTKNGIAVLDTCIQSVDWSQLLKSSAVLNPVVEDKMLVTSGAYTIGSGGGDNYASPTVAYADVGNVAVGATLTFTHTTTTTDSAIAIFSKNFEGTFNHNGANLLYTNSSDSNILSQTYLTGSTGNVNMYGLHIIGTGSLTATRTMFIHDTHLTGNFSMWNCRFNGNNSRYNGMSLPSPATYNLHNCIIKNCDNGTNNTTGITLSAGAPVSFAAENCIVDKVAYCVNNATFTTVWTNCVFINSRINNILNNSGSTSNNCATDGVSVGAATNNSPQVDIVSANEFVNTDITDMSSGYRLKSTSPKLYGNGAAPSITGNTADIYGQVRPGTGTVYSIGVHEPAKFGTVSILPTSGTTAGGTSITASDTGYGFGGTFSATVKGNDATSEIVVDNQHGTLVTPAGTEGAGDVVFTGIDGDIKTLPLGFTYTGVNSACEMLSLRLALSGAYYSGGY